MIFIWFSMNCMVEVDSLVVAADYKIALVKTVVVLLVAKRTVIVRMLVVQIVKIAVDQVVVHIVVVVCHRNYS